MTCVCVQLKLRNTPFLDCVCVYVWLMPFSLPFGLYDPGASALCFVHKKAKRKTQLPFWGGQAGNPGETFSPALFLGQGRSLITDPEMSDGAQDESTWLHLGKFMTNPQKPTLCTCPPDKESFTPSCRLRVSPDTIRVSHWKQLKLNPAQFENILFT